MKETYSLNLNRPLNITVTFVCDEEKWGGIRPSYRVRLQSWRYSRTVTFWGPDIRSGAKLTCEDILSSLVSDALLVLYSPSYEDVLDYMGEFSRESYRSCIKTRDFFLRAGINLFMLTDL